jgi:hypothetical protein
MMLLAIILPIFPAIFWHTGICTGKSNGASIRDFGLPEMALIGLACSMIYFIAGFMTHDSAAKTTLEPHASSQYAEIPVANLRATIFNWLPLAY